MKEEELDNDRLGKIIELAKRGVGGEKENAIRIVKKLCEKHGLNFDDTMNATDFQTFKIDFKRPQQGVLRQVIARYWLADLEKPITLYSYKHRPSDMLFEFETTHQKYIEALNAFSVLWPLFIKEKKKIEESIFFGFLDKHDLYPQWTEEQRERLAKKKQEDETKEQAEMRAIGSLLSTTMDDAHIHKQIGAGTSA